VLLTQSAAAKLLAQPRASFTVANSVTACLPGSQASSETTYPFEHRALKRLSEATHSRFPSS